MSGEAMANTHSAGYTLRLQARLEALERESSNFLLAKAQWEKDRASLENQLRETIKQRDGALQASQAATSTASEKAASEVRRLQIERDRLKRQLDVATESSNNQINQLEIFNTQLQSKVAQINSELCSKESEAGNAVREAAFMRENLERIVKELVERNKRTEADSQARIRAVEVELQEILDEHKQQTKDVITYRRLLTEAKEEISALEGQVDNAKYVNQELVQSIDALQRRLAMTEDALHSDDNTKEAFRRAEEETRGDLEAAIAKLEKADAHIKSLSDEAAATNVALVKLRHQLELADEAAHSEKSAKDELLHRMFQMLRGVGEEMDKLSADVDETVGSLRDMAAIGDASVSRIVNGPRAPICTPDSSGVEALETTIFATAMRVRDTTALMREDAILLQRGIVEEALNKRHKLQQIELNAEAFHNERQAVQQLTATIADLEQQLNSERNRVAELEATVRHCNEWMAEAVSISDERTKRTDALLAQKSEVEKRFAETKAEVQALTEQLKAAKNSNDELQSRNNIFQQEVKQHILLHDALQEEMSKSRHSVDDARRRQVAAELSVNSEREETQRVQSRIAALETELQLLRKRLDDASARLATKEQHTSLLEQNCTQLRDQLFVVQKRYEDLLRKGDDPLHTPSKLPSSSPYRSLPMASTGGILTPAKNESQQSLVHVVGESSGQRGISPSTAGLDRVQSWERRINSLLQQRSSYE